MLQATLAIAAIIAITLLIAKCLPALKSNGVTLESNI